MAAAVGLTASSRSPFFACNPVVVRPSSRAFASRTPALRLKISKLALLLANCGQLGEDSELVSECRTWHDLSRDDFLGGSGGE